jgi:hypothetical protein
MLAEVYKSFLRPGERFYIVSIANTQEQSRIALQGVKDLINGSVILKPLITRETSDTLELSNGCVFRAMPASSRGGRGMACPLVIFDEIAHSLDSESNAAGGSLYQALAPSVAQFGKLGKILMLSSPWIQSGIFWDMFRQGNSGNFSHMQVRQEPSWVMSRRSITIAGCCCLSLNSKGLIIWRLTQLRVIEISTQRVLPTTTATD